MSGGKGSWQAEGMNALSCHTPPMRNSGNASFLFKSVAGPVSGEGGGVAAPCSAVQERPQTAMIGSS